MPVWNPLVVQHVTHRAADVRSFVLAEPTGVPLPGWTPGAHVDVRTADGLVRQYSLCGSPDDRTVYRIAVLREPVSRGGSAWLHDSVWEGDVLEVSPPRNNFPLADAPSYLFVAGGIGITPMLPMIAEVAARGADWRLYYGGRTRTAMAFLDELAEYGPRVHVLPQDRYGLLPLADILVTAAPAAAVHACGPSPMLDAVERVLPDGLTLHVERFTPRADVAPDTSSFEVQLASTGAVVPIAAGQSIVDALRDVGVDVPTSCREGTCASCETTVLDGEAEHRDSVLSEAERATGKTMILCVSRARSPRLVLDI